MFALGLAVGNVVGGFIGGIVLAAFGHIWAALAFFGACALGMAYITAPLYDPNRNDSLSGGPR